MEKSHYRNSALGDDTRLPYEPCAQTESEAQSQRPGEYMVDLLGKKCDAPQQRQISLNERGNLYKDGYGWVSTDGCLVDNDSTLRNSRNLTNPRLIQQLFERPYLTVPFMGRGLGNAALESELKSGVIAGDRKQCKHAGASIQPDRMKYCLYANPQNVDNIVPTWRWGGEDTRMNRRRENYYKRCGKKN